MKVNETVRRETGYIALVTLILSVLMEAVFLIIGKWDLTVLWGNLLSGAVAVLNFFLMGLTVQKAVAQSEKQAKSLMKISQLGRLLLIFGVAALEVLLPNAFNVFAALIPLFFPRIAVALRTLFLKRNKKEDAE